MDEKTPKIDPRHAILMVMDYQTGIISRMPNAEALVGKMAAVIETARASGLAVGYVRVAFTDEDAESIPQTSRFKGVAASMHADAEHTQIHDAVAPHEGDVIVRKTRIGAFSTTDLDQQLKDREIDTLILAGLSTSGVLLSTVRDAADRDYRLYVLEDVSADGDPEVHALLTGKIFPRQAHVIASDDLAELIDR